MDSFIYKTHATLCDPNQGAGHANHTRGNGAEFPQDPLSLPSGPITRLRAKRFKEALNGLIQKSGLTLKRPRWAQKIIKV
jgi:hypothetical protein